MAGSISLDQALEIVNASVADPELAQYLSNALSSSASLSGTGDGNTAAQGAHSMALG